MTPQTPVVQPNPTIPNPSSSESNLVLGTQLGMKKLYEQKFYNIEQLNKVDSDLKDLIKSLESNPNMLKKDQSKLKEFFISASKTLNPFNNSENKTPNNDFNPDTVTLKHIKKLQEQAKLALLKEQKIIDQIDPSKKITEKLNIKNVPQYSYQEDNDAIPEINIGSIAVKEGKRLLSNILDSLYESMYEISNNTSAYYDSNFNRNNAPKM